MARTSLREFLRFNPLICSSSPPPSIQSKRLISSQISLYHPTLLPLQSCHNMREFLQIHAQIIISGLFQSTFPASRALKFVADSGDIAYTLLIFHHIDSPDAFCANTVIKALSQSADPSRAVAIYFEMLGNGFFPNNYTFPPLVNSCVKAGSLSDGEKCHGQAVKNGVDGVLHVRNAMLHMYASCGLLGSARQMFDAMTDRDLVSWNSMVDGYVKMGDLVSARRLFDEMVERNVVSWNVMIAGYLRGRNPGAGLKLFRVMGRSGVRGTITTMVSVVTACGQSARLKEGRSVHGFWVRCFLEASLIFETALIDMYCKCGRTETARRVFDAMLVRNLVCWNAMILGHCIHGYPDDGLALFEDMVGKGSNDKETGNVLQRKEKVCPDEVTFIGVLCACVRAKSLSEGKKYFDQMTSMYNLTPTFAHYWCMANLYGSVGLVQEAEEVLKSMPEELESLVWSRLLGLCRFRGDVELGERIAKRLIELEPYTHSRYALLWNVYAATGKWEDVAKVKEMMMERGLRATHGSSLVNLNELVHEFKVGDRSQPEMEKIYMMMDELAGRVMLGRNSLDLMEFG
ncbi:hypothetical protein AAC387_Pa02g2628 [Persea americana]